MPKQRIIHHVPLKLDLTHNGWDQVVEKLTRKGFCVQAIMDVTGLSKSQVAYRQRNFGLSVLDYRKGRSAEAMSQIDRILIDVNDLGLRIKVPE